MTGSTTENNTTEQQECKSPARPRPNLVPKRVRSSNDSTPVVPGKTHSSKARMLGVRASRGSSARSLFRPRCCRQLDFSTDAEKTPENQHTSRVVANRFARLLAEDQEQAGVNAVQCSEGLLGQTASDTSTAKIGVNPPEEAETPADRVARLGSPLRGVPDVGVSTLPECAVDIKYGAPLKLMFSVALPSAPRKKRIKQSLTKLNGQHPPAIQRFFGIFAERVRQFGLNPCRAQAVPNMANRLV